MFALIFVFSILLHNGLGSTMSQADKLMDDKFANYNINLRPVLNQSEAVKVEVELNLIALKELDEVNGKISISGALSMIWIDETMKWNSSDYGGINELTIQDINTVWKPTIVLLNNAEKLETLKGGGFIMLINSSGRVQWSVGSMFSATCHVDITFYPWDTQECGFEFSSWGYAQHVALDHFPGIGKDYFIPNGVWDLVDSSESNYYNMLLVYKMKFKRRPGFIFSNVILPIIFLSLLNLVVFLIPIESGERLGFCITVLLSIAVFLTIVGDNLPKTSNPMSILGYYLISVLGMSLCITLATVFSLRIYFRDEREPLSTFWRGFVRVFRCRAARINQRQTPSEAHADDRVSGPADDRVSGHGYQSHGNGLTDVSAINVDGHIAANKAFTKFGLVEVSKIENGTVKKSNEDMAQRIVDSRSATSKPTKDSPRVPPPAIVERSWKDASAAVDALSFVLFLITYISFSLWCGLKIITNV